MQEDPHGGGGIEFGRQGRTPERGSDAEWSAESMSATQMVTIDELREEFEFLGDWESQCRYLIELGEELPDLPASDRIEENRVQGCQARVWLTTRPAGANGRPHLQIRAKSDARIVDGLIVVLLALFNDKSPEEILATDFRGLFTELGLETHLVPQRRNGLYAMVERIRQRARDLAGTTSAPPAPRVAAVELPTDEEQRPRRRMFDVDDVRLDFPALQKPLAGGYPVTFLDSASSAQKPQVVIDKEREVYEQYYANAYRGVYRYGDRVSSELERAREKVKWFIGAAGVDEIVFTSGTTMSLNLVANAWGRKFLGAGDEVLLTEMEHHANLVPWQWVAKQTGAVVKFIPLTSDGRVDQEAYARLLSPRTRMVAITGMSNVLGTVPPSKEMARRAKENGSLVLVDAAQSIPHLPVNVVADGIDFLAFSGHKVYGPSGVGVLYGRRDLLAEMDPFLCGGHMIETVTWEGSTWAKAPAKFEAGTPPIAQAIALGTALDYLSELTLCPIHKHEQSLLRHAHERLAEIPGLRIYGPATSEKGAIVSFSIAGAAAGDLAQLLDLRGVCVRHGHHCTMPLHQKLGVAATVRASFALYNTLADVDRLIDGLRFALGELGLPR
jgi:cysteine desulfurase/selenocysteine lyase